MLLEGGAELPADGLEPPLPPLLELHVVHAAALAETGR